jgi:rhamnosyltransferase
MGRSPAANVPTIAAAPAIADICAIVVAYFPDDQFSERLEHIRKQTGKVVIVDNTGDTRLSALLAGAASMEVIPNNENLGIAAALNQGMSRAIDLGFTWAITFDQDTWVQPNLVATLLDIYQRQASPERIGIIGCNYEDENVHRSPNRFTGDQCFREVDVVITSGSLMPTARFPVVGPFREDLFIDFVDHEYCLRLRKLGYKILSSTAPLMLHALGAATPVDINLGLGTIPFTLANRSALRRYYMTRNALLVARSYLSLAPMWVLGSLARVVLFAPLKIPFERSGRWNKFRATFLGVFDAVRSKTGKVAAAWLYD